MKLILFLPSGIGNEKIIISGETKKDPFGLSAQPKPTGFLFVGINSDILIAEERAENDTF